MYLSTEKEEWNEYAYIRESYGYGTAATHEFAPETWSKESNEVHIPAKVLQERLPKVKEACIKRAEGNNQYAEEHYKDFVRFVDQALKLEKLLGPNYYVCNSY